MSVIGRPMLNLRRLFVPGRRALAFGHECVMAVRSSKPRDASQERNMKAAWSRGSAFDDSERSQSGHFLGESGALTDIYDFVDVLVGVRCLL